MKYIVTLLLMLFLVSCGGGKNPAELRGKERYDYLHQHGAKYFWSLKAGMSKDEVRAILGPPDNSDDEYVWFYAAITSQEGPDKTWTGLLEKAGGDFYVFYNNKLILGDGVHWYPSGEGGPYDILLYNTHLTKEEVLKLLNDARAKHLPPSTNTPPVPKK